MDIAFEPDNFWPVLLMAAAHGRDSFLSIYFYSNHLRSGVLGDRMVSQDIPYVKTEKSHR